MSRGRNSCWADLNEALRNESPPKQADLAKVLDIHVTYISGIERGIRNMSLKNIEKLSKALKVPIEELIK
ncbi:MAG: helix-turn-helix transcriptional regulator [Patescibacteria group bacterium]